MCILMAAVGLTSKMVLSVCTELNTGALSLISTIFIIKFAELENGAAPLSCARMVKVYEDVVS